MTRLLIGILCVLAVVVFYEVVMTVGRAVGAWA